MIFANHFETAPFIVSKSLTEFAALAENKMKSFSAGGAPGNKFVKGELHPVIILKSLVLEIQGIYFIPHCIMA